MTPARDPKHCLLLNQKVEEKALGRLFVGGYASHLGFLGYWVWEASGAAVGLLGGRTLRQHQGPEDPILQAMFGE